MHVRAPFASRWRLRTPQARWAHLNIDFRSGLPSGLPSGAPSSLPSKAPSMAPSGSPTPGSFRGGICVCPGDMVWCPDGFYSPSNGQRIPLDNCGLPDIGPICFEGNAPEQYWGTCINCPNL